MELDYTVTWGTVYGRKATGPYPSEGLALIAARELVDSMERRGIVSYRPVVIECRTADGIVLRTADVPAADTSAAALHWVRPVVC